MERNAKLSLFLSKKVHGMLHDMSKNCTKTDVIERLVKNYDDTPLNPEVSTQSGFRVTEEVSKKLAEIAEKNQMKSRNQVVVMLIEKAHEEWSKTK